MIGLRFMVGTLFILAAVVPRACVCAVPPFPLASDGRLLVDMVLDQRLDDQVRDDFVRVLERLVGARPVVVDAPKRPNLNWSGRPRQEQPDFTYRQIWWAYGGPSETAEDFRWWRLRNKAAYPAVGHGHNLTNTVPPKEFFATHPEYYALIDGQRKTTQLCTSNADVIHLAIALINDYFDRNPQALSYSLCPDDNKDILVRRVFDGLESPSYLLSRGRARNRSTHDVIRHTRPACVLASDSGPGRGRDSGPR